jgi:Bacteriocin-protection, YdeI or OmpD-Associated
MAETILQGTVHQLPDDLREALLADDALLGLWQNITPLGRNEFICWVEDAKQPATRQRRIKRTGEELLEGKKRPCCWQGCIHRTDKAPSKWQQDVLIDKKKR